jgi:DNA polymerase beta palm/Fingers domain of DNA polymerase lambda
MPLSPFDCLGLRPVLSHRSKENFGKNLDDTASSSSPSVVLLGSASTDGTTEPDEVIIGRLQLLSALLSACGCGAAGDQDNSAMDYTNEQHQPKPTFTTDATAPSQRCQECRDTFHWASYALSRRMFRFENKGSSMQVRGKHATVKVNEMTVDVSTSENDDWSQPPIQLQKGDRLQIFPRSGRGSAEFQVVPVQILPPTKASVDHNNAKKTSIRPQNGKGDCTTKGNDLAKVEQENMKQTQISEDVHDNELQPKPISTIKATKETGAQKIGPTKIFFVPSGHDFFEHRRQILQQKLEELGAVFTNKIFDAQYIVISGSVRSLGVAAKRSAVLDSKLQKHLQQHQSVQCLLPSWADECISSQTLLLPPGRKHVWPHYRAHASPQRKREHDTMEQSKKRQRVAVPSSSRKPFPNNVKCAEVFKQLSNLHQDMPLLDLDQWKSYCFRIAAGRLLHLDFEVDTDPATLRRLRGVKGFGKSVVDKIEEILNTGTVSRIHEFQHHPERVAMKKLTDIWGVGRVKAKDLMVLGYKDIHDVRDGLKTSSGIAKMQLDRNQLVGVDCYEDILDRMNRDEVEQIKDAVEKAAQRVYPGVEVTVQGSYRRGKRTCGDVDIHLTHRSFHQEIPDHALGNIMGACVIPIRKSFVCLCEVLFAQSSSLSLQTSCGTKDTSHTI